METQARVLTVKGDVLAVKKNGTEPPVPETITLPLEEFEKFRGVILMAIGSNMKRMLVVNDMCAIETRNLMRESILSEMNNLNRLAVAQLERLCTPVSSKELSANAQP